MGVVSGAWSVVSGGRWSLVLISGGAKNRPDGGAEVGTGGGCRSFRAVCSSVPAQQMEGPTESDN